MGLCVSTYGKQGVVCVAILAAAVLSGCEVRTARRTVRGVPLHGASPLIASTANGTVTENGDAKSDKPAKSTVSTHLDQLVRQPEKQNDPPGIHNLIQVNDRIFSGSEPHGDEGLESLAEMGVKTIVSVDGARPAVEAAKEHGLRYVHIPIGYNGIDQEAGKSLARVAREAGGPIYIHCHHGTHRGPAAAAVACMAEDGRSGVQALAILKLAGTGDQYAGLWRDVENYKPPKPGEPLPELVAIAEVDSFPSAMAKLDRHFDNLKLCGAADWKTPDDHPDLDPAQEALLLLEGLKESARHVPVNRDEGFRAMLAEATANATELEQMLRDGVGEGLDEQFKSLDQSCKQCHGKYRN